MFSASVEVVSYISATVSAYRPMSLCQQIEGLLTPISPHIQRSQTVDVIQAHAFSFLLSSFVLHGFTPLQPDSKSSIRQNHYIGFCI